MYYHISNELNDLSITDKKLFIPRIPLNIFLNELGESIEDSITPRVCLSPTILGCIIATHFGENPQSVNIRSFYSLTIFATKNIPNILIPKQIKKRIPQKYKGIVPDYNVTHEVWSLDPIELTVLSKFRWEDYGLPKETQHKNMLIDHWKEQYNSYMPKKFRLSL